MGPSRRRGGGAGLWAEEVDSAGPGKGCAAVGAGWGLDGTSREMGAGLLSLVSFMVVLPPRQTLHVGSQEAMGCARGHGSGGEAGRRAQAGGEKRRISNLKWLCLLAHGSFGKFDGNVHPDQSSLRDWPIYHRCPALRCACLRQASSVPGFPRKRPGRKRREVQSRLRRSEQMSQGFHQSHLILEISE